MPSSITQSVSVAGQAVLLNLAGVPGSSGFLVVHRPRGRLVALPPLLSAVSMQSAGHTEKEQSTSAFGEQASLNLLCTSSNCCTCERKPQHCV